MKRCPKSSQSSLVCVCHEEESSSKGELKQSGLFTFYGILPVNFNPKLIKGNEKRAFLLQEKSLSLSNLGIVSSEPS